MPNRNGSHKDRVMASKALPSQEVLRQLLDYDPEAGKLFWRQRPEGMFVAPASARRWNSRYSGKEAFTALCAGYPHGHVLGEKYLAHRVAWVWIHGAIAGEIDHINGDKRDFSIKNLREVDRSGNMRNACMSGRNTSGHVGVSWCSITNKWRAGIQIDGRHKCLGRYQALEDAVLARKAGEMDHGFHANHGRLATCTSMTRVCR